jgi:hypothetical protein
MGQSNQSCYQILHLLLRLVSSMKATEKVISFLLGKKERRRERGGERERERR